MVYNYGKKWEKCDLPIFTAVHVSRIESLKVVFIALLLAICTALAYYFHFVMGEEMVCTHFFYIPIVLASFWWGTRGSFVSLFLVVVLSSHMLPPRGHPLADDLVRGLGFLVVGCVLGIAIEERNRCQREALKEKNKKIEQMLNHAEYVDEVDSEKLNAGQKELIDMLDDAVEEMGRNIKHLTEKKED